MQRTSFKPRLRTLTPLLAVAGLMIAQQAMAHGFTYDPPSRAFMCGKSPGNTHNDCKGDSVQWEPQSLENHTTPFTDSFPNVGPVDGKLASAGDSADDARYPVLNEQSADRWQKTDVNAGEKRTFKWAFTAPHPTKDISFYITKNDWDPNKPLTKAEFDPKPICTVSSDKSPDRFDERKNPKTRSPSGGELNGYTYFDIAGCTIPADHSGYHVIMGVWNVSDPAPNSFVSAIDVNVKNGGPVPPTPTWKQVGTINPSVTLHAGDQVGTRVFKSTGEVTASLGTSITIQNEADGAAQRWPYLLAQQVNKVRGQYYMAGQKNGDTISPATGVNQVYVKTGSDISDVETQVTQKHDIIGQKMTVDAKPEYAVNNGQALVDPYVTLSKKAAATASVYNQTTLLGTNTVTVDGGATVPVTIANATAGNYKLVITAPGAEQQSFDVKLSGGGGKYPQWQPNGTYNNGDMVSNKGANYACKVAGWCGQPAYEPGGSFNGGTAWPSAWTKQ